MHASVRASARAGQQLRGCPALASYGTDGLPFASSALSRRASAFRLSLDPLTPRWGSARRDTGFPVAAAARAMLTACMFRWRGGSGTLAGDLPVAEPGRLEESLVLAGGLVRPMAIVP